VQRFVSTRVGFATAASVCGGLAFWAGACFFALRAWFEPDKFAGVAWRADFDFQALRAKQTEAEIERRLEAAKAERRAS